MRRLYLLAVLFLILSPSVLCAQSSADEVLTNESVIKLVQSGVGANLIIKMINEQPANFRLGSANVIQLKQKGVPQSVISAMLSKKSESAPSGPSSQPATPAVNAGSHSKPVTPNFAWEKMEKTDPITGQHTFAVVLETPALSEEGGRRLGAFEVTATCSAAAATLRTLFGSDQNPAVGLKQNSETYLVPGGLAGALTVASHHQKAWTVTRIRVGDDAGKQVTSEDDYNNAASVYFTVPQPSSSGGSQDEAGMRALLQFATFIGPNKPAGQTEDLFRANTVLLEMELENGVKTLLTIKPQDPVFQEFAGHCRALVPVPAPASSVANSRSYGGSSSAYSPGRPSNAESARPALAPRLIIPAGAKLTMAVQEPLDLNDVHAYKMAHAKLTEPMKLESGSPSGANVLTLDSGTDIFLHCAAAGAMGDRLNVRLELDHAVVHGTVIPLRSQVQTRQTSRGLSTANDSVSVRGIGAVRLPQNRTAPDPVLVQAKESLTFSTFQPTYAPVGFKP